MSGLNLPELTDKILYCKVKDQTDGVFFRILPARLSLKLRLGHYIILKSAFKFESA